MPDLDVSQSRQVVCGKLSTPPVSVVIPTYQREGVLLDTIDYLLRLEPPPAEILIVDQTPEHERETALRLASLESAGEIRHLRLPEPSITRAMNVGLREARHEVVLFLDDDIVPDADLIAAHARSHSQGAHGIVAGQVLQPGEEPLAPEQEAGAFRFCSSRPQFVAEFIGCNFSVKRALALRLGGFDENFVQVAYRYEAEFSFRALQAGEKVFFEPRASIRHLKVRRGGTRAFGYHLTTVRPSHAVGAYYYLLRASGLPRRLSQIIARPFRAIRTRHHLARPWWIPATLVAEALGFFWAVLLLLRGPRLVGETVAPQISHERN